MTANDAIAADAGSALSVSDLSFRYPGACEEVLTGVCFSVAAGQVLGVLGANGSGKSTLLHAILDVRRGRRGGRVGLAGHSRFDRRDVGLATQQVALYQQLTVLENLRHVARTQLPGRQVRSAVDAAVAEFGLDRIARQPVHRLSGGWQRMAHLATSFVHRPTIRLLDEPTAALDFEARSRLVELIYQWRRAGMLMLVTSHYPEDIEEICTHAVLLRSGTVARYGTLAELLRRDRRELVVEAESPDGILTAREPAPTNVAEGSAAIARMARALTDARIRSIRLTGNTLREQLAADPQLKDLLDDDGN
jgi:ABC-2 type transport system ATP-binding protein